jgi:hypothetical protein
MPKEIQFSLPSSIAFDELALQSFLQGKLNPQNLPNIHFNLYKRSIDARSKDVKVNITIKLYENELVADKLSYRIPQKNISQNKPVIIVGAGPAGLFAALKLIELGLKPIIVERGKDVRERRRDLAILNKQHIVNPESNYCFGEGGAGTYSDGKLYTRSDKRGNVRRILEILVAHGAKEDILIDSHPHIGTNKLPQLIEKIRNTILQAGGEIHFNSKMTDIIIRDEVCKGIIINENKEITGEGIILATGHSARDVFHLLHKNKIEIENKPFALGVRIEHSQRLIDIIQYHCENRGEYLPPSSYSLVAQTIYNGVEKGVFSFCMCPGGIIAPCATEQGEIVVNGWSPSKRNNEFANSGIVVSIDESDWRNFSKLGNLAALEYQKSVEINACLKAGNTQKAPAQRLVDFQNKKVSDKLLDCSYQPGLSSVELREVLPIPVSNRLQEAFVQFGKKMKGYLTNEAQLVAVESRTSSPVRILREKETCEHVRIKRFFPCGEGAGYAGGIVSAAMDGERCAENLYKLYA